MQAKRLILVSIAMMITSSSALTQELADRQKGRLLARQVCAECHAIGRQNLRSPNTRSPSFAAIAATPGMTAAALNAILHTSHRDMPNIILNGEQTAEITAYILSLKR